MLSQEPFIISKRRKTYIIFSSDIPQLTTACVYRLVRVGKKKIQISLLETNFELRNGGFAHLGVPILPCVGHSSRGLCESATRDRFVWRKSNTINYCVVRVPVKYKEKKNKRSYTLYFNGVYYWCFRTRSATDGRQQRGRLARRSTGVKIILAARTRATPGRKCFLRRTRVAVL